MDTPLRVLIVEDSESDTGLIIRSLARAGYRPTHKRIESYEEMRGALDESDWDIVIADHSMPRFNALAALKILQEHGRDIPFIVVSGSIGEDTAVALMKAGAHDYVMKENLPRLAPAVQRELSDAEARRERKRAEEALRQSEERFRALYDDNPSMYFTTDSEGIVLSVNRFGAEELGYGVDDLIGQPLFDFFHADDREAVRQQLAKCFQRPMELAHWEFRKIRRDGSVLWVKETARAVPKTDGSLTAFVVCEDITERKQAQILLSNEKERLAVTLRSIGDGVITTDTAGRVLLLNKAAEDLTGWTEEQAIGRPIGEVFHIINEQTREVCSDPVKKVLESGSIVGLANHTVLIAKDGAERIIADSGAPIRDRDGKIFGVVLVFRDVTERKKAEQLLRQSEEKYRTILESIEDSYLEIDLAGNLTFFNPSTCRISGYSEHELTGMNYRQLTDESTDKKLQEIFREICETGTAIKVFDCDAIRKDGGRVHVETSISAIKDDQGNYIGFRGISRDVTELRRAEEEKARLATAIEQAAEGFAVNDTNWTVQYVNPAFERITGYDKSEIIGQRFSILKSGKHDKAFYRQIRETLTRGDVWSGRIISKRKDGSLYEEEVSASPVRDQSGNIVSYVGMHRDITREVRLEQELRQAQKMEAIGTLAGGIAHDFNNILTAIVGYAEMAFSKTPQGSPVQRYLKQILESSSRASDLVNHILAFSRQREQEHKPVAVGAIINEAYKLLRSSLPSSIEILPEITATSAQSLILADSTQIHQVIMNLCTNAAHSMRAKGGRLGIRLSDTVVDASFASRHPTLKPGPYVRMTVSDTGHGMDAATMERIFDPYFTTKGHGEGTGLGLAVVQRIIKNHGGAITVYSEPERGTTFQVFFPRFEGQLTAEPEAHETLPRGSEQILFVDDEPVLVDMGREMLESLGYRIVGKTNSLEALQTFCSRPEAFDLVITDMTMPGMGGTELAKELMTARPGIPIILCTGFSEFINCEEIRELGIRELLMKPYVISDLAKTIRIVLGKP